MAQETQYDFNHTGPVGWTVIVAVLLFVIWKVWPELKTNNIFMNDPPYPNYAMSEATKKRMMPPVDVIVVGVLYSLGNIFLFLLHNSSPIGNHFLYPINARNPYISGLTFFIAIYVYSFVDGSDFSQLRDFRFAARAWLSTILICSTLFFVCGLLVGVKVEVALNDFFFTGSLMQDAGIIIFVATLYSTNYFSRKTWKIARKKKFIIMRVAVAWLITAIILYFLFSSGLLMLICLLFAIVLAGCLLFYKMTPVIYSDETAIVAENVDTVSG